MTMKAGIKQRWVRALRSGDYKQGSGALRRNGQYCCLGVLSDLAAADGIVSWSPHPRAEEEPDLNDTFVVRDNGLNSGFLPPAVAQWAGMESADPYVDVGVESGKRMALTSMNDCGDYSFNDIADAIEAQL